MIVKGCGFRGKWKEVIEMSEFNFKNGSKIKCIGLEEKSIRGRSSEIFIYLEDDGSVSQYNTRENTKTTLTLEDIIESTNKVLKKVKKTNIEKENVVRGFRADLIEEDVGCNMSREEIEKGVI